MKDEVSGIECGVVVDGRFLVEYGESVSNSYQQLPDSADTAIVRTVTCVVPCPEGDPEFRVVVRSPPRSDSLNAVMYVDGEMCISKCRSGEGEKPLRIDLDAVRVSVNEARSLKFKKVVYNPSAAYRPDEGSLGVIRVDVWNGIKGYHSYDPILKYGDFVEHAPDADLEKNVLPYFESKLASVEITHKIDYGPVLIKPDRRRHFEKQDLLCRFIFHYRDKAFIQINGIQATHKLREQQRRAQVMRELQKQGPITIDDSD